MLGLLPEDVALLVTASDPRVSPDGTQVLFTVTRPDLAENRYQSQVWVAMVDGATPPAALTPPDVTALLGRWSPDGLAIAYAARAIDDDEGPWDVVIVRDGVTTVVARMKEAVRELEWSPDGASLAFVARDPDPEQYGGLGEHRKEKDMPPRRVTRLFARHDNIGWTFDRPARVFVVPASADGDVSAPRALTDGPVDAGGIAWSPDSSRIAFASGRHENADLDWAVDIYVVEVDGGEPRRCTVTGPEHMLPAFSPDGARLACLRTGSALDSPRHAHVVTLPADAAGVEAVALTTALDRNCSPYPAVRAPTWDADRLVFLVEDAGRTHVWSVRHDGTAAPEPVLRDERSVSGFDQRAGVFAFVASSASSLPEVYVHVGGTERKLTDFSASFADHDRQIATPVRFVATAPDGTEVECWAIEPSHAAGERVPTLLNVHGGPFTQYGDKLFDEFQYEIGAGFGVVFCNPRGSSGYSEAWGRAIRWPECEVDPGSGWGGVDYDDVMACVDAALERFDWVDPARLGVMGGSYGGYMTSWIIGHTDRFAAAVSERAVNNLLTEEHNSDIAGSFVGYVGVPHVRDPAPYVRQSPVTYVEQMHTPLMIVHSENDLRCPINQAEELFVALRLLGRTPEFVRVPGESHELTRSGAPRHRQQRAEIILDFFRRHLGAGSGAGE